MMSFLFVSQGALASVNLQTGAWHWKLSFQGMEVTYNSRSLHHGWWGQGWCSDLEAKLENNRLYLCSTPVKKVIQLKNLTSVFHDGKTYIFDSKGKLTKVLSMSGKTSVIWDNGSPSKIKINNDLFQIKIKSNHIVEMKGELEGFNFKYDKGLLLQSPSQKFSYDNFDNLIKIVGNKIIELSYTEDDRIFKVKNSNKCKTIYGFDEFKHKDSLLLLSKVHRECLNKNAQKRSITKVVSSEFKLTSENTVELIQTKETYL